RKSPKCPGPGSGYVVYCEGGRFEGQRGAGVAFDQNGKEIRRFKGNSGNGIHQQNFIDSVRSRDTSSLNTDVQIGHHSTGWCNLANIAFQTGSAWNAENAASVTGDHGVWGSLLEEMKEHLGAYNLSFADKGIRLSPMLNLDIASERFVGEHAEAANALLKRQYREPYVVPEITV
ncbi:MAG: gfo/Idh/MocA family oxidoreductase, partial [Planctomycetaceae bacterium]|nr:gfo/Idh/MocA family oxidoreductase [Planctomycetaceae bacterium]